MMTYRSDNIFVVTGMVIPATSTDGTVVWVGMSVVGRTGTHVEVPICSSVGLGGISFGTTAQAVSCRWSGEATSSELSTVVGRATLHVYLLVSHRRRKMLGQDFPGTDWTLSKC